MKKLWKQEWGYHIFAMIVMTAALIVRIGDVFWNCYWDLEALEYMDLDRKMYHIATGCDAMFSTVQYYFLNDIIWIVLAGILIKKGMIYWIEKDQCGRNFIQSLPVRRVERCRFHVLMDVITVIVAIFISGMYVYIQCNVGLLKQYIEIPWLFDAVCGLMVSAISYIFMILGFLYFVESLLVNGCLKVVGFVSGLGMLQLILEDVFLQFRHNQFIQAIYGFFTKNGLAGNYYCKMPYLNDMGTGSVEYYYDWAHDNMNPPIQFQGEKIDFNIMDISADEMKEYFSSLNQIYDFSRPSSYLLYVLGYLAIGFLLIGIACFLTNKQELSKDGFYFAIGRYLFSGLIAVSFYVIITIATNELGILFKVFQVVAMIVVFIVMLYLLNTDRKNTFRRKVNAAS